eukprot:CAMPEP_0194538552 /NCGR_PEP_ID=MMETSP0253-20130528/78116_1 /TAXON_ID=2966 /ORGANISM="Noctiluca scintillans" /LENGTH=87 /DNA_ID=CAMNT_0039384687 /DNA_START=1 /DNA_END=261 /DNA_ORIENTATION=+
MPRGQTAEAFPTNACVSMPVLWPEQTRVDADSLERQLFDENWRVRLAAVQELGRFGPSLLLRHARAINESLTDSEMLVRRGAVQALG